MALNNEDDEVERSSTQESGLTSEPVTEAIRLSPAAGPDRADELMRWLREEVWVKIPADQRGRRLTPEEESEILGYT